MEPRWLAGSNGYSVTVTDYMPGQNKKDALLVELDKSLKFEEFEGKYLVLELRYAGDQWLETGVVHLELLSEPPERVRWQDRNKGKWIESHASYSKIRTINKSSGLLRFNSMLNKLRTYFTG
jgi:hypothetical protein